MNNLKLRLAKERRFQLYGILSNKLNFNKDFITASVAEVKNSTKKNITP